MLIIGILGRLIYKKESLGGGDIKLFRGAGTVSWNRRNTDGLRHFHFCERISSGVSDDKKAYKAQRAETSGALYRHIFGDLSGHFTSNEL